MTKKNIFNNLYVLDIANNHYGDLQHGKNIINAFSKVIKRHKINATFKFQFRNLDTFISKSAYKSNNSYIDRFQSTRLSDENYYKLIRLIKINKVLTSCTPFDEESVSKIEKMKFDIIKIASVSANEWPLLERVSKNKIPKIISTGGLSLEEIDEIVSFFRHKNNQFALMHCISIYPTNNDDLQLNVIKDLKKRYKDITIGWSTHESPDQMLPGPLAYACGARMFEKHINIKSKKYSINKYSIKPEQYNLWLEEILNSEKMLGNTKKILKKDELITLNKLKRGMFAKRNIKINETINSSNTYFAFPKMRNQLSSGNINRKVKLIAKKDIKIDNPVLTKSIKKPINSKLIMIKKNIHQVKAILNYNNINVGKKFEMEISHHYGIEKFRKIGCFLFNCINREYAKKIIVMLPNQKHPLHFHRRKEETFQVLSGKLISYLNNKKYTLNPGDSLLVKPNTWHKFQSDKNGCIFEEVSTTHYNDDSIYKDEKINNTKREIRKTIVNKWGRFELSKKFDD